LALECHGKHISGIKAAVAGTVKGEYHIVGLKGGIQKCADRIRKPGGLKHIFPLRDKSRGDKINDGEARDIVSARSRELQFMEANHDLEPFGIELQDMAAQNRTTDFMAVFHRLPGEPSLPLNIKNVGVVYRNSSVNHGIHPAEDGIPLAWPKLIASFNKAHAGEEWADCVARHERDGTTPHFLWVYAVNHDLKDDMSRFLESRLDEDYSLLLRWAFTLDLKYKKDIENLVAYAITEKYREEILEFLGPAEFFAISNWRMERLLTEKRMWLNRQPRAEPNAERNGRGGDNNLMIHRAKEMTPWSVVKSMMVDDAAGLFKKIADGEI